MRALPLPYECRNTHGAMGIGLAVGDQSFSQAGHDSGNRKPPGYATRCRFERLLLPDLPLDLGVIVPVSPPIHMPFGKIWTILSCRIAHEP